MNKGNTILALVAALVIGFSVGYIVGTSGVKKDGGADKNVTQIDADQAKTYPTLAKGLADNPFHGPEHGKVTLVEVSDFQ